MQTRPTDADRSRHVLRLPAGLLLLAVWSVWAVAHLAASATPPPADSAEAIRARLLAFAPAAITAGQAVAFRLRVADCACAASTTAPLPGIRSVDLRDRAAPPALPYALIVFDAQSRLIYAGPAQLAGCGSSIAAASLIPRLLATSGVSPLISPASCGCPIDSKESLA
ncbi:hypothetical protein [Xanthomonas rydalmerensis]|uniref:Uncharacterized protein n=1 Tax=Xanthomonas rydalmerensis TaxID=3046274 RepID=A0ABZ0JGU6_9XANT|nr:hypothetical protein [Xanthomonas sp. DM-2023]WOS38996.1 hypothetical protein QN243_11045 [Xanthomonas sp. DM-2023]WOS43178.1 hypothetical protein QN242_11045 [Xanthomonas sp. DM-2023]WOS47358.1 hypothetical protein QN240_11045 [Xanthomonas sp. DM-2023]WOS51539.1 hypothetical protein QN244_11045 [Xanthomonas sp. DM-2023]WOS55721.1 hypothetical protein QN245_11045 [Xanthomonas sp. DM-2023]